MFKIFSKVIQAITANANASEMAIWVRDPMSHPDIEAMDSRALGDLPFGLFRVPNRAAEGNRHICSHPA